MDMPSTSVTVRRATVADAPAIAEIHVRSWQWAYRGLIPDTYLDSLSVSTRAEWHGRRMAGEGEGRTWVAEQGGNIVGFVITGPSRDADAEPRTGEIGAIYLRHEVAGTGVGHALLTRAVDDLRRRGYTQATLWVLETNARARRFYAKNGWVPDGASKTEEWREGVILHEVRYRYPLVP